jgi:hemerythrin HHE cation binding domain-containing protein
MKRSAALAPLSRDHQHALAVALSLRRATPDSLDEAVRGFLAFFDGEGEAHFGVEEQHLLPALPADDPQWAPAVARIRDDHAAIRAATRELRSGAQLSAAQKLGERLNDHVRFEERVAFAVLEERLDPDELGRLGSAVAAAERAGGSRP